MFCTGFIQQFSNSMAPAYLYYSSVPVSLISLILGFIILRFGDKKKSSTILLFLTIAFFFLFASNLVLWIAVDANIQTFVWFLNQFDFLFLPLLSFFLFSEFIKKNETPSNFLKVLILAIVAIFIPIVLLGYNINYFDLYNCTVVEANSIVIYQNAVLILSCLLMAYLAIKNIFSATETRESKTKTVLLAVGLCSMLFSLFFTWNPLIFGYPDGVDQFGFIGAIIFLSIITYMVVKFKMFGMKLLATQALVWGIAILTGSQLFFIKIPINFILTSITFVGVIISGRFLIKSVKNEIKQKEELAVKNEQLSEFMSFASHEIKGPTGFIKSIASMALSNDLGALTPKLKEALRRIYIRSNDLIDLASQYLNKSKVELNQISYAFEDFDLGVELKQVVEDFQQSAEEQNIIVKYDNAGKEIFAVKADKVKMKEVFRNIIGNSIKFTPKGSVVASISKTNDGVLIKITDTGNGIEKEKIPTLFKKFSRADTKATNAGGSGLGLYLARVFIEAHHGKIWVESEGIGKGTTFFIELPANSTPVVYETSKA
ncbi:MAG: PAS/PAC sensor signal transduction histidine kinase [Parcubacteria group bacterium GW2011_GWA2_40_37]|nr:MAG: PAS/PAC sensor signal transduction histidine kinase [Parcubacteria group bacterium GW2011_GWA2_40_37]